MLLLVLEVFVMQLWHNKISAHEDSGIQLGSK